MGKSFSLAPRKVPRVETKYRTIVTDIPAPDTLPVLEKLRAFEPRSMSGQPPIVWHRAEGINVYDRSGNRWLDFSSGVLVANSGHANPAVLAALKAELEKPLLHHYCFPAEERALLVERLATLAPEPLKKVFLLTTGSETVECVLKLARTWGRPKGKKTVVSFTGAFHGRTLGSQSIGGIPALKEWIVNPDKDAVHVPFPGDPRVKDRSFAVFEKSLAAQDVKPRDVCLVISETYQGGSAAFMPPAYAQALRKWCDTCGALLVFDEVQAGFGRTGTLFGFEHYGVVPDMMTLGKGISSSLPLSAVIGRADILDLYEPGTMTSTHTGNPICCAAALANIEAILAGKMTENAAAMGPVIEKELNSLKKKFPCMGFVMGKGMVWGVHIVKKGTEEPDADLAVAIVARAVEKGLLLFAPVGFGGATLKVSPPLCIAKEAIEEGCATLGEAIEEALKS